MFDLSSSSSINTNFFFIDFLCVQTGFYHRLSIEFVLISIENHIDQIYNLETQQYFKILFIFWSLKFWLTLNRIWNKSQKRLIFDWIDINYVGIFFFSFDKALLFSKNHQWIHFNNIMQVLLFLLFLKEFPFMHCF